MPGHPIASGELYMIDRLTGFFCSRIQGLNYNSAGVYDQKTVATDTVTTSLVFDPALSQNRVCYKILITFDLKLNGGTTWDNKKVSVLFNTANVWNYHFNIWDFTNYDGSAIPHELLYNKIYIDNPSCLITTSNVVVQHDATPFTPGDYFSVRNLRINYFLCPIECERCLSSQSCEKCKNGLLFYQRSFDPPANTAYDFFCNLPYQTLRTDDNTIYQTKSLLFKPKSFFVLFNKEMNFTSEVERFYPYFIPKLLVDRSRSAIGSRLLQDIIDVSS